MCIIYIIYIYIIFTSALTCNLLARLQEAVPLSLSAVSCARISMGVSGQTPGNNVEAALETSRWLCCARQCNSHDYCKSLAVRSDPFLEGLKMFMKT